MAWSGSRSASIGPGLKTAKGMTLWDQEQLQQNIDVKPQNNTEFRVTTSDTIDEKAKHLEVDGELKLSLLGNLVTISGAARYFNDTKKSFIQERLTMHYRTTTKFEQLTMNHLAKGKMGHHEVFDHDVATRATFDEAMKVYTDLPKMLGENGEHAVPVRVWLYPLVKLDSKAAKLERNISTDVIRAVESVIEALNFTNMKCGDLLQDTVAKSFTTFYKQVQDFQKFCYEYKQDFMKKLGFLLPDIRGGKTDISADGQKHTVEMEDAPSRINAGVDNVFLMSGSVETVMYCITTTESV
ncbi:verrucotoxin subunit beta isoform X1 [Silurus meridionalis]|nr:verrucotoxin subunit beta isoform X1 [Silurus meridionalis]